MEIREALRALRTSWLLIVLLALVGTAAGAAYIVTQPRSYVSSTRVFVSVQGSSVTSAVELGQGNNAATAKVRSYLDVVTSTSVLQPVVDDLGLTMSAGTLARHVSVDVLLNSVVMQIEVTTSSAADSAQIANAIGKSFIREVTEVLEKPSDGGASLVSIKTIEPAKAALVASNPSVKSGLAVGLLVGLVAGVSLALLRRTLDVRLHGPRDIEALTDSPVIGTIGFDPTATSRPLILQNNPRSPRAEAFRALRTNLQFLDVDNAKKTFVLTSAMPSEGKSTTAANLAIALAETGARVALVDTDLRKPRVADIMGLDNSVGLTDALIGQAELDDVLQPWGTGRLSVLPAGRIPPNPSELLGSRGMKMLLESLADQFDFVIFDAPPLLPVTDAAVLSKLVDGLLLVAASKKSKKPQFAAAVKAVEAIDSSVLGVILTMLPTKGADAYGYGNYTAYYGSDSETPRTDDVNTRRAHLRKQFV